MRAQFNAPLCTVRLAVFALFIHVLSAFTKQRIHRTKAHHTRRNQHQPQPTPCTDYLHGGQNHHGQPNQYTQAAIEFTDICFHHVLLRAHKNRYLGGINCTPFVIQCKSFLITPKPHKKTNLW